MVPTCRSRSCRHLNIILDGDSLSRQLMLCDELDKTCFLPVNLALMNLRRVRACYCETYLRVMILVVLLRY